MSSPADPLTIPDRITGRLPLATWDTYFHAITKQLSQEFPGCDEAQYMNLALGHLQMIACGNAALDSLASFGKVVRKRGEGGDDRTAAKRGSVKSGLKRVWRWVFDF